MADAGSRAHVGGDSRTAPFADDEAWDVGDAEACQLVWADGWLSGSLGRLLVDSGQAADLRPLLLAQPTGPGRTRRILFAAGAAFLLAAVVAVWVAVDTRHSGGGNDMRRIDRAVLADGAAMTAFYEDDAKDECGNSINLNDFSSKSSMRAAGWNFNWSDPFLFRPINYQDFAPPQSYWGFCLHDYGSVSLELKGNGIVVVDFGNLMVSEGQRVTVYINGRETASAGPSELSQTIEIQYTEGDILSIGQNPSGIIVINQVTFRCITTTVTTTSEAVAQPEDEEDAKMRDAEKNFKEQHKKLAEAAQRTKKKEQVRHAVLNLEQAELTALEKAEAAKKASAVEDTQATEDDADKIQQDLADLMEKGEDAQDPGTQPEKTSDGKSTGKLEEAPWNVNIHAKHRTSSTSPPSNTEPKEENGSKYHETEAKKAIEYARRQIEHANAELAKAQAEEQEQAEKSDEAATKLREAMKEKEAKAKSEMVVATTAQPTTTLPVNERGSLYCFTLMLPFGYEPDLLAEQRKQQVGFYKCDEFQVFSNSSTFLDKEGNPPLPLDVQLLDFSLAVAYGGKWHTALNTPVFKKVWKKVHALGRYLEHDWVVKADIDTVWFPERLRIAIAKGVPQGALGIAAAAVAARRRLDAHGGCTHCKKPAYINDTCEEHVRWLQIKQNKTCREALAITAQPPPTDCGCNCLPVEACDLSADPDSWLDGHYIKGKQALTSPKPAVYINNCRFGLHGPIEVFSSDAVTSFVTGMSECDFLLAQPWGEDKYLDRCMMVLGVTRVNIFGMLSEVACGDEPAPCGGTNVAFHPFKKPMDYFACYEYANSYGHGPFEQGADQHAKDGAHTIH